MISKKCGIVFIDWDGTLCKSLEPIHEGFVVFCESQNVAPPTLEEMMTRKEHDWYEWLCNRGYCGTRENAVNFFRKYDDEHPYPRELYADAKVALEVLAFLEIPICLLTLNEEEYVKPYLYGLGLHELFFHMEFGCADKATAIRDVCRKQGAPPRSCVFVGDTPSDMRHARNSGAIPIAILNGHLQGHHFAGDAEPDHKVRSFSEVIVLLVPESVEIFRNIRLYGAEYDAPHTR